MDYQPTNYINGAPPAINDVNLNHIETAVDQAFQAINSGPIKVDTIAGLKALSTAYFSSVGETRWVLGYYVANDGGGGLFVYNSTSSVADNGGTVIAPNAGGGRWDRVLPASSGIRVAWFGAKGDGTTNDTSAIQAAIDYVSGVGGGVVKLDAKVYIADDLTLKSHVVIEGLGPDSSEIRARPSSGAASVFKIGSGPNTRMGLKRLSVGANGNSGQHGLYFNAVAGGVNNDGGAWYSVFDEIIVGTVNNRFSGACIWFRGGTTGSLLPHQLNELRNVNCWHSGASGARALKLTGMCGQFQIIGGEYEGVASTSGTAVEVGYELDGSNNPIGTRSPYNIEFLGATIQLSSKGLTMNGTTEVVLRSSYFESTQQAATVTNSTWAFVVEGTNFSNAGSDGGGGGYILSAANNSQVMFRDNLIQGSVDTAIVVSSSYVESGYNSYGNTTVSPVTSNMTRQITAAGSLDLGFIPTWLVNTSATQVNTITSGLFPGARLYLRSWTGPVTYNETGNISLSGRVSPLTVPSGAIATFIRMDLGQYWNLESVSTDPITLSSDVINATTSYADVTGLSFAVNSGVAYRFRALIIFTVNATTTGSAWSVNGPATPTQLAYTVTYPSITTTYPQPPSLNSFAAYNAMTATTATPATSGNIAEIRGIIQPSASGTFAIRFASEVAVANGVVAKAGSSLEYW